MGYKVHGCGGGYELVVGPSGRGQGSMFLYLDPLTLFVIFDGGVGQKGLKHRTPKTYTQNKYPTCIKTH